MKYISRRILSFKKLLLILFIALLFIFVFTYHIWLTKIASFLVIDEKFVPSDAIVVLSLNDERLDYAADLFRRNYAPLLVVSCGQEDFKHFNIFIDAETGIKNYLIEQGISKDSLILFSNVRSTYDEAVQIRELVKVHGYTSLIVVSNPFHLRRSRFIFEKVLRGLAVKLYFSGPPLRKFGMSIEYWWTREDELLWVFTEYVKLILYWMKY